MLELLPLHYICEMNFRAFLFTVNPFRRYLSRNYSSALQPDKKELLTRALQALVEDRSKAVWLLRITKCNADESHRFSKASCQVESIVEDSDNPEAFPFAGLYLKGIKILQDYLAGKTLDLSPCERTSLDKLINFLEDKKENSEKFLRESSFNSKYDIQWTATLAHYLLRELAVNPEFVIDKYYSKKETLGPELEKNMEKRYGDTSIGNPEVWHGCTDILIGQSHHVQVDVKGVSEENDSCEEDSMAMFEENNDRSLCHRNSQILSEALVFGCLQKTLHPELNTFIPTVGISKENVVFYFYDSESDLLIESSIFDIFETLVLKRKRLSLAYDTILALWLTLNYKYLSSGVTQSMLDRKDYRAKFWDQLPADTENIYKNMLRIGDTRMGTPATYDVLRVSAIRKLVWNPARDVQDKLEMSSNSSGSA